MLTTLNDLIEHHNKLRHERENDKDTIKWMDHSTRHGMVQQNITKRTQENGHKMSHTEQVRLMNEKAICPKCESVAFRDKGWREHRVATCPSCGWSGKTVTIKEYLNSKSHM